MRLFGDRRRRIVAELPGRASRDGRRRRARRSDRGRRTATLGAVRRGRRATPRTYEQQELPPPLAEPRLDVRVDTASALAYEVRAGEFIQVIDVEGKQCSDFLAFHRRKLEAGVERGLDATTTRSIWAPPIRSPGCTGSSTTSTTTRCRGRPRHGRPARHVRARLYGQVLRGPGLSRARELHGELQRPGAAVRDPPREGWEALNFFYNTGFDASNVFVMDEPWSRPGDYVLLRAMSDLVCASSGLPGRHRPRERLADHADPRPRVRTGQQVLRRDRAPRHGRRGSGAHARDDVPSADERADEELRGVPRLLAAALLRQRGGDRRVLGVPRAGGDHGPLPAAQVGDPRARR